MFGNFATKSASIPTDPLMSALSTYFPVIFILVIAVIGLVGYKQMQGFKKCPRCMSPVPKAATRCPQCTSEI